MRYDFALVHQLCREIGLIVRLEHIPLTHTHTPHVQRNFHIVGD